MVGFSSQVISLAALLLVGRRRLTRRQLARCLGVPLSRISRICRRLAWAGLVRAIPGGGYHLARRPESISVVEVLRVLAPRQGGRSKSRDLLEPLLLKVLWPVTLGRLLRSRPAVGGRFRRSSPGPGIGREATLP
ncbi:MAG: Rrf2 family transcriptional regulator [Planctomycetota bacterium]